MIKLYTETSAYSEKRCINAWIPDISNNKYKRTLTETPIPISFECLNKLKTLGGKVGFSGISAEVQNHIVEYYNRILLYEIAYDSLLQERRSLPRFECCGYIQRDTTPKTIADILSPSEFEALSLEGKKAYVYDQWNLPGGWTDFLDNMIRYVDCQISTWNSVNSTIKSKDVSIILVYD